MNIPPPTSLVFFHLEREREREKTNNTDFFRVNLGRLHVGGGYYFPSSVVSVICFPEQRFDWGVGVVFLFGVFDLGKASLR